MVYYNEMDPNAAKWLRGLIKEGLIADGEVDDRSILDVEPSDLRGFRQCHFFAGIGGWSLALREAGWADDKHVWTASLPCQPFSSAGIKKGVNDERHLFPTFFELVKQLQPSVVFGEQVASSEVTGGFIDTKNVVQQALYGIGTIPSSEDRDAWFNVVCSDLESETYEVGAVIIPACGFGAPHIRSRLYWVADSKRQRHEGRLYRGTCEGRKDIDRHSGCDGSIDRVANTKHQGSGLCSGTGATIKSDRRKKLSGKAQGSSPTRRLANTVNYCDHKKIGGVNDRTDGGAQCDREDIPVAWEPCRAGGALLREHTGPTNGFWRDADWLYCTDGYWRPAIPSYVEMVDGPPEGVVRGSDQGFNMITMYHPLSVNEDVRGARIKGYGNAIVIPQAKAFIESFMEISNAKA